MAQLQRKAHMASRTTTINANNNNIMTMIIIIIINFENKLRCVLLLKRQK